MFFVTCSGGDESRPSSCNLLATYDEEGRDSPVDNRRNGVDVIPWWVSYVVKFYMLTKMVKLEGMLIGGE